MGLLNNLPLPPPEQEQMGAFSWRRWFTNLYQNSWKYIRLQADSTVSTTTYADVSGMVFKADPGATYIVEVIGRYQTALMLTGIGLALDIPSGTVTGFNLTTPDSLNAEMTIQTTDNTLIAPSSGVYAGGTNTPIYCKWLVNVGTTGGNIQLRQRSEVATSNTTLKATDTVMGYRRL